MNNFSGLVVPLCFWFQTEMRAVYRRRKPGRPVTSGITHNVMQTTLTGPSSVVSCLDHTSASVSTQSLDPISTARLIFPKIATVQVKAEVFKSIRSKDPVVIIDVNALWVLL